MNIPKDILECTHTDKLKYDLTMKNAESYISKFMQLETIKQFQYTRITRPHI